MRNGRGRDDKRADSEQDDAGVSAIPTCLGILQHDRSGSGLPGSGADAGFIVVRLAAPKIVDHDRVVKGCRGPAINESSGFRQFIGVVCGPGRDCAQGRATRINLETGIASRGRAPMVKRRKEDDPAGILEFEGRTAEDPELVEWLADHRARNGGKIRVSKGGRGVRVMFSKEADMLFWKQRSEKADKAKRAP